MPTDTPGWRIVRHPEWMGSHSPGGHPEIALEDVRVPLGNLLGDEGAGFKIAQQRLAGGRLAHAMRWIGAAQRALDLSSQRLLTRKAFGKELARHQGLQFMLADSAMDLYASRLMVLHTAWKVEQGLPHRQEVAMTKTFVSEAFGRIADRAVQMHGAAGIAMDLPISRIYQDARAARIYDGASEVHRMVDRARPAQAGARGRLGARRVRGAVIAADDIVRTRADAGEREPLLVVDPLLAFLDAHGLGEGEPAFEAIGDGHSNVTFAVTRGGDAAGRAAPAARAAPAQRPRRAARGAGPARARRARAGAGGARRLRGPGGDRRAVLRDARGSTASC